MARKRMKPKQLMKMQLLNASGAIGKRMLGNYHAHRSTRAVALVTSPKKSENTP